MRVPIYLISLACGVAAFQSPTQAQTTNHRVLAIRVEFPYEDPDHDTTSGRGVFDLEDYYAPGNDELRSRYFHPWDVPPHDRDYFAHHLQALDNYWNTVSEGRVSITADIYPRERDSAYRMSNIFYKYGNGRTTEETYRKLVDLLVEAATACKNSEGGEVDFSEYDTIMIIHAGIGSETSGELNDIPSAYISREDIRSYAGQPLVIDGRSIEHAIVVPEMTAANGVGGLNGIMAQMFGHRLGLPSMSNNDTGLPAAGGWCLMDTGAMAWGARTRGFVPTHPSAWSKIELGWIEPVTVTADTTLSIAATHIAGDLPRAVRIPVTTDEYFLIENRRNYAPRDSLASAVFSDSDSSGVWLRPDHYDAYIPGSGILIWRINDRIIRENRADGSINDDPFRRGIDLIEADGRQDIGALFGFGDPRAEYTEGHAEDTYHADGNSTLGPDTFPASESLWGGGTGVTIHVNSAIGDTMSVTITFDSALAGFPVEVSGARALSAADLDGDGFDELIVSTGDSAYVCDSTGDIIGAFPASGHPAAAAGDNGGADLFSVHDDVMTIYRMENGALVPDWSSDGGDTQSIIRFDRSRLLADPDGMTYWASARRYSPDGRPVSSVLLSPSFPAGTPTVELPDTSAVASLSMMAGRYAAVTASGKVYVGTTSTAAREAPLPSTDAATPLILDTDRDGSYETVIATRNELLYYDDDGAFESRVLETPPVGSPAAADVDADGYPEVVLAGKRSVSAFRTGGIFAAGFPFELPPGDDTEIITASPLIADLDGDGGLDIVVATSNMRLVAWDMAGNPTPGFPLTMRGSTTAAPAVFNIGDDGAAIAYVTDSGMVMAHDLAGGSYHADHAWPMEGGGPGLSRSFPNERIAAPVKQTATFEAICYPNPVTGGAGTFRITPREQTDCRIEVFTVDGRRVFEAYLPESSVLPGVPNEVRMDSGDLASGLYLARITTRRETAVIKVGVLK